MKYWVGVTDNNWYQFLADLQPEEVNFWQPSAKAPFTSLASGTPFLFKLKRPYNHIAGVGFFLRFTVFPVSLVWEAFGTKNGQSEKGQLLALLNKLRHRDDRADPNVGCSILTAPTFFPENMWIEAPEDWAGNIVRGKTYDTEDEPGARLWDAVEERLRLLAGPRSHEWPKDDPAITHEEQPRYGKPRLASARLGQGSFRLLVTDAYERRCAITGERTLPVLEAAHIRPFGENGPHATWNGLLLRSDFHKLFDRGLVTVTPSLNVEVSPLIREQWFNGKAYYSLHGKKLAVVPSNPQEQPQQDLLAWHNENVFTAS